MAVQVCLGGSVCTVVGAALDLPSSTMGIASGMPRFKICLIKCGVHATSCTVAVAMEWHLRALPNRRAKTHSVTSARIPVIIP